MSLTNNTSIAKKTSPKRTKTSGQDPKPRPEIAAPTEKPNGAGSTTSQAPRARTRDELEAQLKAVNEETGKQSLKLSELCGEICSRWSELQGDFDGSAETFLQKKFGYSELRIRRYVRVAGFLRLLEANPIGQAVTSESQVRKVVTLDPKHQLDAWKFICNTEQPLTEKVVSARLDKFCDEKKVTRPKRQYRKKPKVPIDHPPKLPAQEAFNAFQLAVKGHSKETELLPILDEIAAIIYCVPN